MAETLPQTLRGLLTAGTVRHWRDAAMGAMQRTSGPLRLADVLPHEVVHATLQAALAPRLRQAGLPLCNLDQSWWRSGRPPHHWHQDGALHHDFFAPNADGGLMDLRTCWIALTECGVDAPSLEWVDPSPAGLLPISALPDVAVLAAGGHRRNAQLSAGDALWFDGALLHRTHLTPTMSAMRISLELRFFADPPPARVAHERLQRWV